MAAAASSSANTSESSPLLKLPPELRNMIYHETLVTADGLDLNGDERDMKKFVSQMQLLHVCRQIRNEAHDVFWSANTFRVTCGTFEKQSFSWLERIGKERAALIRRFTIAMTPVRSYSHIRPGRNDSTDSISVVLSLAKVDDAVRCVLDAGVPTTSINVVRATSPESSASDDEQVLAKAQEEFNKKVLKTLYEHSQGIERKIWKGRLPIFTGIFRYGDTTLLVMEGE